MLGPSVRLVFVDGSAQGLRTAEVCDWTGVALICPRTDLMRLATRAEIRRSGVYILVGPSEFSTSGHTVYVGHGHDIWRELSGQDQRDFWTWVVIFVSKNDGFIRHQARWIEARLIAEISRAKRAEHSNGSDETQRKELSESDASDMEIFYENVRLLLPTLGLDVLGADSSNLVKASPYRALTLEMVYGDAYAECVAAKGQFIVKAGSTAQVRCLGSPGESRGRTMRALLRAERVLVPVDGRPSLLRFTQEYVFDSPSEAAAVVSGAGLNGRTAWKIKGTDMSYGTWQAREVAESNHFNR